MNTLVFDIETIPDIEGGRRIYELGDELDADGVAKAMFHLRFQKAGTEFLPHHLHLLSPFLSPFAAVAMISKVWSLGDEDADEAELIQRFFDGVDRASPRRWCPGMAVALTYRCCITVPCSTRLRRRTLLGYGRR
ncbi:MAG: hypothetical protein R3E89_11930 [Thiolinea sp.]